MMNIPSSNFSSGCESGWTVYLDQSYVSNHQNRVVSVEEDGEEGLSMVSDASSGPPHCHEDDREDCLCENASSFPAPSWGFNNSAKIKDGEEMNKSKKKKKNKKGLKEMYATEYHSCLDDTASSPVAKNKSTMSRKEALMDYSHGFSATHFKGNSAFDEHYGMLQSSLAKGSASQEPGNFEGAKWK